VAGPTDTLVTVSVLPLMFALALPTLLLLVLYGATPPPTAKVAGGAPLAIVTAAGAEVKSACVAVALMETAILTWVPTASMTKTCAVPEVVPLVMLRLLPEMLEVTKLGLLVLVR